MAGAGSYWWNQDTPEDKVLLALIRVVEKLGHLPDLDDIEKAEQRAVANPCVTYFGSFANACKRVAQLLYGHQDLTSPNDLLPQERELPEEEQRRILAERYEFYLRQVQELKEPNTLSRWRKEEVDRRFEARSPEGYTVTQIPLKTVREMIQLHESSGRKTTGIVTPSAATTAKKAKPVKKSPPSFRKQWEDSQRLQREQQERLRRAQAERAKSQPIPPTVQQTKNPVTQQPKPAPQQTKLAFQRVDPRTQQVESAVQQSQNTTTKDVKVMGGPRRSKVELLEMLYVMSKHYGRIPSDAQMREYARAHDDQCVANVVTFRRGLGNKDSWEEQLSAYMKAQGRESFQTSTGPTDSPEPAASIEPTDDSEPASPPVSEATPVEVPPAEPTSLPVAPEESKPEELPSVPTETPGPDSMPKKTAIKINLTSLLLKFQLGDQDYELEVSFGASDISKNAN